MICRGQLGFFDLYQASDFLAVVEQLREANRAFQAIIEVVLCAVGARALSAVGFNPIAEGDINLWVVTTFGTIKFEADGFLVGLQYLQAGLYSKAVDTVSANFTLVSCAIAFVPENKANGRTMLNNSPFVNSFFVIIFLASPIFVSVLQRFAFRNT